MRRERETVTLIGAGLNGPLLAVLLVKRGYRVQIYERRPDMRRIRMSAGRSINLALSARGIHALNEAGLWQEMRNIIIPMKGRIVHRQTGDLQFQPYGKDESEVIYSISRADLNIALLDAAEAEGVSIQFGQRCIGVDGSGGTLSVRDEETGKEKTLQAGIVIGCDGSASAIRTEMLKLGRFNFSQQYLDYGYKELTIPASPKGQHLLEPHGLHIWPRGTFMLIALPNSDGTCACILFLPFDGADSFAKLATGPDVAKFFRDQFPDAERLMPHVVDNYFANPTGSMITVKCSPWHVEGKALLLGDAAHAIVPFFGQGLNCGFEDCTVLGELLDRHGSDWPRTFTEFEAVRKVNTDAIADMAIENFVEMRDRVGDPRFFFRKKVELALQARYPQHFVPKYAMVTFHRIPYSLALARGAIQDRMLTELCNRIDRVEDLDWARAEQMILDEIAPLEQTA